jgi:hypothetical protein
MNTFYSAFYFLSKFVLCLLTLQAVVVWSLGITGVAPACYSNGKMLQGEELQACYRDIGVLIQPYLDWLYDAGLRLLNYPGG